MKFNDEAADSQPIHKTETGDNTMLFTVAETAKILKTNVDYVHKLRRAKLLPFIKLGQYKVRRETLAKFLESYEGKDLTNPFDVKELNDDVQD